MVCRNDKIHKKANSLVFVNKDWVWSSGRNWMIRLHLKIPKNFMSVILPDRFWLLHMPCSDMIKFQSLAQFLVYYLPTHSYVVLYSFWASLLLMIMMRLILLYFTSHNLHLPFCYVLSIFTFNIIGPCFVLLLEEIHFFSMFLFYSHIPFSSCAISLVVIWNHHTIIFLPISISLFLFFCLVLFPMLLVVAVISLSLLFLM